MTKIRVYELAKQFKMTSKNLITKLDRLGIKVANHMTVLSEEEHQKFIDFLNPDVVMDLPPTAPQPIAAEEPVKEEPVVETQEKEEIPVEEVPVEPKPEKKKPAAKTQKRAAKKVVEDDEVEEERPSAKKPSKRAASNGKPAATKPATRSKRRPAPPIQVEKVAEKEKDVERRSFRKKKRGTRAQYRKPQEEKVFAPTEPIEIDDHLTLAELAEVLHRPATELIMKAMEMGEMYTMNSNIPFENAELLAMEYDISLLRRQTVAEEQVETFEFEDDPADMIERAPVVTVMGHVDHGKTSVLDYIRSSRVARGEAGGITQHIGASEVKHEGKRIVFLDTPGHEAFTTLRARGAGITDIAVLVIAADDGVMPQTVEAIHHAKAANVPIIVAINKMDKPDANPERVMQELTQHGLVVESWGGDVISVKVSAKTGEGIDQLMEMILLVAEVQELTANPKRPGIGTIIEANVDKRMGNTATVLLETGTMSIGDSVFAGASFGRLRTMINDQGKRLKTAGPSTAFKITGLSELPMAGDKIYVTPDEQTARNYAQENAILQRRERLSTSKKVASLDDLFDEAVEGEARGLNIILRADVHGSVEAIRQSLEKLNTEEVQVNIIKAQVGAITEADILLATASEAVILGFNVRPNNNIQAVAERENVEIRTYRIIYDIINDVKDALSGMLSPDQKEVVEGNIEVRDTFRVPGVGTIAGGYVQKGKISRTSQVRLIRDGIVIYEGQVSSLKRFKDDVRSVATGYECGIGLKNYNDIKEGDIIETFLIKEIQRSL